MGDVCFIRVDTGRRRAPRELGLVTLQCVYTGPRRLLLGLVDILLQVYVRRRMTILDLYLGGLIYASGHGCKTTCPREFNVEGPVGFRCAAFGRVGM